MSVVDRLLIREEIDALELDLAQAREHDTATAPVIEAHIIRLEALFEKKARSAGPQAWRRPQRETI
ncbi:MAG: hypothetical protein K2P70_04800 [Hyphomonadaceae bacterium]|nr:hypothetical protein [Hyphomonadaceae bacterium]